MGFGGPDLGFRGCGNRLSPHNLFGAPLLRETTGGEFRVL